MRKIWKSAAIVSAVLTAAFACASVAVKPAAVPAASTAVLSAGQIDTSAMMAHPTVRLAGLYVDVDPACMFVVPYYLDIMAIHSLANDADIEIVRDFILWSFGHLNYPDRWGLEGTLFDYVICADGTEHSTRQYDSADGYAGQFLMLLRDYWKKSGDRSLLESNRDRIFDVASVILELQQEDGLSIAMESYPVEYLMDNGESYGGLVAFEEMARAMKWKGAKRFTKARKRMGDGIRIDLYDSKRRIFYWAIEDQTRQRSDWSRYYPDALAQLFPILYEAIEPDSDLAKEIWKEFSSRYDESGKDIEQRLLIRMTRWKMEGR
jgi:hypothetical protein